MEDLKLGRMKKVVEPEPNGLRFERVHMLGGAHIDVMGHVPLELLLQLQRESKGAGWEGQSSFIQFRRSDASGELVLINTNLIEWIEPIEE